MSWRDLFSRPKPIEPARIHIPATNRDTGNPEHYRHSALRRRPTSHTPHDTPPANGMWVRYGDNTGIITNLTAGDTYTVMLVDHKGENKGSIRANGQELRQAYYDEIPPARRPEYSVAASFGYHTRPA